MKTKLRRIALLLTALWLPSVTNPCAAGDLDTMGVTRLRGNDATLTGTGIPVAQPEGDNGNNTWEVDPLSPAQPFALFTWINTNGSSTNFPNSLGLESGHADGVGYNFYGSAAGVAPGVLHVDSYDASYFVPSVVSDPVAPFSDQVINQSFIFIFDTDPLQGQEQEDSAYDDYIAIHGGLFCSGVGDGGSPSSPATAYNGLGVGAYGVGAATSIGPTLDNGRSKPDLVAPAPAASYSTPYVSGAGAVLLQAAARGDGGANTNAALDIRTIKALLLNGAIKPGDWTHTTTNVLDTRYGAGILNLYYSYQQLAAGRHPFSVSQSISAGGAHPPGAPAKTITALLGWDYQTNTSSFVTDTVENYYFDNSANAAGNLTFTATLVWNRAAEESGINNLALFLYNCANSNLVAESVSKVDNVQHLYIPSLPRGQYDLQVVKFGDLSEVSDSEIYALAFQFYPISPPPLAISLSGANAIISWPWSPTVFNLEQTTNLTPLISWTQVATVGLITNTSVVVTLGAGAGDSFYQLSR